MKNEKATAVAVAAVGTAALIGVTRGMQQGMPASTIALAIGCGLVAALLYFGAIHWLLKGWDRLRRR